MLISEDEATGGLSAGVEEVEQEGLEVKCTEMKVLLGTVGNTHAHGSTLRESSWKFTAQQPGYAAIYLYLTSLSLRFFISKMGMIITVPTCGVGEEETS